MKFLLTSTGITNENIKESFLKLVGKRAEEIKLAYIPTAVNMSKTLDKRWMVHNLERLDEMKIGQIDIVDFSAIPKDVWLPRLELADVWFVEGGNPFYLKLEMEKNGLDKMLNRFPAKVYVGCSAGSMVLGKIILKSDSDTRQGYKIEKGLNLFDFSIRPHFGRVDRPQFSDDLVANLAKEYKSDFYAIDDETAINIEGNEIKVISEGKWKKVEK
jgi:dipeptidase E